MEPTIWKICLCCDENPTIWRSSFIPRLWQDYHQIPNWFMWSCEDFPFIFWYTVWLKSQTGCTILYCKRPIWRVGVWPKWAGPAHSTLDQSTRYTSRLTYSKMSDFCPVVLKWHTFVFLSSQLWLILVLAWWSVKYKCVPFQNYWTKSAHILMFYHWNVYNWLTKWAVGGAIQYGPHPYPLNGSFTV